MTHLENARVLPDPPYEGLVCDFQGVDDPAETGRPSGGSPGCWVVSCDTCAQAGEPVPKAVHICSALAPTLDRTLRHDTLSSLFMHILVA